MGYEATLSIGITIKDGPPPVQEKRTITDVIAANANRISFVAPDGGRVGTKRSKDQNTDGIDHDATCRLLKFSLASLTTQSGDTSKGANFEAIPAPEQQVTQSIVFVAIKANKYTFKRCVNNEASGIGFRLISQCDTKTGGMSIGTCNKIEWIKGDRILLNVCGALHSATGIEIYVDDKLFDCTKKEADEISVTVTYGVTGPEQISPDGAEECCKPEVANMMRSNGRHVVMS